MQKLYGYLLDEIFRGVIEQNQEVIKRIESFDGAVFFCDGDLLFTLPELFKFVSRQYAEQGGNDSQLANADYHAFRGMLYKQPTNETLKQFGAIVRVDSPNKNYALTVYRLTHLDS